jgi:hypothetical protein
MHARHDKAGVVPVARDMGCQWFDQSKAWLSDFCRRRPATRRRDDRLAHQEQCKRKQQIARFQGWTLTQSGSESRDRSQNGPAPPTAQKAPDDTQQCRIGQSFDARVGDREVFWTESGAELILDHAIESFGRDADLQDASQRVGTERPVGHEKAVDQDLHDDFPKWQGGEHGSLRRLAEEGGAGSPRRDKNALPWVFPAGEVVRQERKPDLAVAHTNRREAVSSLWSSFYQKPRRLNCPGIGIIATRNRLTNLRSLLATFAP